MKIILSGGGTLGSVTPLIAVAEDLKTMETGVEFLWLGTKGGPEKKIVEEAGIKFKPIFSGKLRRYLSLWNLVDLISIKIAVCQSLFIIIKEKPDMVVSAGGFVAVPVVWASWLWGVPVLIHQQDFRAGLANKLCAPFAEKITVALEKSLNDYSKKKAVWIGNPARKLSCSEEKARKVFNMNKNKPVILIIGGGTGSLGINKLVLASLKKILKFAQVIHLTGSARTVLANKNKDRPCAEYYPYEFITKEMACAYEVADVVVSRAGMGVLTELASLGKPAILIPLAGHQEENAKYFAEKSAVIVLKERGLTPEKLAEEIEKLLKDKKAQDKLSENIKKVFPLSPEKSAEKIADTILGIVRKE
jgi:UDP-N-acetylglucosamine--N-acetylmuramyl-(pentapeptide) pyrophosphoryl-undecaprenol N-acetylglucosamine transferase